MISYPHIKNIDQNTLRIFCKGTGTSDAEMYAFYRAHAILQLAHWQTGRNHFPEDNEFRKLCMKSFLRNVSMSCFYKREFPV